MIEFRSVWKSYRRGLRGRVEALRGVSFTIPGGVLAGFLGPNGSGKTTSLKLMVGLVRRDSGVVAVKGFDPERDAREVREMTGFLPEKPVYPAGTTVAMYLRHVARLRRVPWSDVRRVARLLGLADYLDKPVGSLSRGYLQRLGLAQALLGQPEVLLLDEPTANLDPLARMEILELIAALKRDLGATVVISSHILPELQKVIDYAVFIDRGVVLDYGRLEELVVKYGVTSIYTLSVTGDAKAVARELIALPSVRGVIVRDEGTLEVHVDARAVQDFTQYLGELERRGVIVGYSVETAYLDQLYRRAVGGEVGGGG